jgi:hypothetical protein
MLPRNSNLIRREYLTQIHAHIPNFHPLIGTIHMSRNERTVCVCDVCVMNTKNKKKDVSIILTAAQVVTFGHLTSFNLERKCRIPDTRLCSVNTDNTNTTTTAAAFVENTKKRLILQISLYLSMCDLGSETSTLDLKKTALSIDPSLL